jgi:hypothetical protein
MEMLDLLCSKDENKYKLMMKSKAEGKGMDLQKDSIWKLP